MDNKHTHGTHIHTWARHLHIKKQQSQLVQNQRVLSHTHSVTTEDSSLTTRPCPRCSCLSPGATGLPTYASPVELKTLFSNTSIPSIYLVMSIGNLRRACKRPSFQCQAIRATRATQVTRAIRATWATHAWHCLLSSVHNLLDPCVSAQLQCTCALLFASVSLICSGATEGLRSPFENFSMPLGF